MMCYVVLAVVHLCQRSGGKRITGEATVTVAPPPIKYLVIRSSVDVLVLKKFVIGCARYNLTEPAFWKRNLHWEGPVQLTPEFFRFNK